MEKEKKTTIVDSWKDEVRRDVRRAATLFYFLVGDVCLIVALVAAIKGHELKGLLMMIIALGWLILARLDGIVLRLAGYIPASDDDGKGNGRETKGNAK